jgi:hypothetical protein
LNWAARTAENRKAFAALLNKNKGHAGFSIRFEPAFSRSLDLAIGEGILEWASTNRVSLTPHGANYAKQILNDPELMRAETTFFKHIGKRFTENAAQSVLAPRLYAS